MGCCGGSNSASVIIQAKQNLEGGNGNMNAIDPNGPKVRIEYSGPRVGAVTYFGKRKHYRFGNNPIDRYDDVNPEDVNMFLGLSGFSRVGGKGGGVAQHQPTGAEFVPEPAGGQVSIDEDPEIHPDEWRAETITTTGNEWVEELSGEPPALELKPLPGTAKEIVSSAAGANLDTLLAWLREEQSGKNRKTAIAAIEEELEKH